jgi:uncharacterized membrane protein
MENFSDAVFAIVLTIMVFEIRVPDSLAFTGDPVALREFATVLVTYVMSFYVIVNLWVSHHYLVFTVASPSRVTIWLNNLLLLWVSLIPITTRFLGMHPAASRAAAAYGFVGAGATFAFILLRSHAARTTHNELHRGIHRRVLKRAWLFFSIYVASMGLAFVSPWLAWACFLLVPPMLFLPIVRIGSASAPKSTEQHALERSCP